MDGFQQRLLPDERFDWRLFAACRGMDTELFFPARGDPTKPAHAACGRCSAVKACLDYALNSGMPYERFGIWGDTSERQRRAMRRGQRRPIKVTAA